MVLGLLPNYLAYSAFHFVVLGSLALAWVVYVRLLGKKMFFVRPKHMLRALGPVAFFIIWDSWVTGSWWSFNSEFVLGWYAWHLPVEEWLFFVTVPFGLLVFVENLRRQPRAQAWLAAKIAPLLQRAQAARLSLFLAAACVVLALASAWAGWWYSAVVLILLPASMRGSFLLQPAYVVGLFFTLIMTLIFNYYLTVLPVVVYDELYKSSVLIGSIPIEDFAYGVVLYALVVRAVYERKYTGFF